MKTRPPAIGRRSFLRAVGQGALLAGIPVWARADQPHLVTISILHTTDLHGHILPTVDYDEHPDLGGLARCATQIRAWRRENPNSLLVDIGDVYQGTALGLRSRGATMIRCLNALNYDAWVIGNHEFDWGLDVLAENVARSTMPVLCGNALVAGRTIGRPASAEGALGKLRPCLVKEIGGFRIAIVALTTPALSTWLPPESLAAFEALDPIESLGPMLRDLAAQKPDAIVLAGHMGLTRRDDYANRIGALTREFPALTVVIGGHTHQNHPGETVNGVLYTQADHFGIYAGKVDLVFDSNSRRLVRREAATVRMDSSVALDPAVMELARADLAAADHELAQPIGELTAPLGVVSAPGQPCETERLIGSAIVAALEKQGCAVDAVVHGLFDDRHALAPGPKTVADAWGVLPYENEIVTIDLAHDDLLALARDFLSARDPRNVLGLRVAGAANAGGFQLDALLALDGSPLPAKPFYRVAMNSYDSQSGGLRYLTVARLVANPANRRVLHKIQVRDALVDFFLTRGKVGPASLLV